jgi:hypothetical protein
MPTLTLIDSPNDGVTVLAAVTAATTEPAADAVAVATNSFRDVRTLISTTGTLTELALQLWIRNARTGAWHRGATATVAPTGSTAHDWFDIGPDEVVTFTAGTLTGTGSVTVHVTGV